MSISEGPYEVESKESDRVYHYCVVDKNGKTIADTFNSDVLEIHEEWDHDFDGTTVRRWDEQGRLDPTFLAGSWDMLRLLKECIIALDHGDFSNGVTTCSGDQDEGKTIALNLRNRASDLIYTLTKERL